MKIIVVNGPMCSLQLSWLEFCLVPFVSIKILCFQLPFLLLFSCAEQEWRKTECWELDSFQGTGMCVFTFDPIKANSIAETFLGLNDSIYTKVELGLSNDESFTILRNKNIALTGRWHTIAGKTLLLTTSNEFLELEIVMQSPDSLVLKGDAYPIMHDVRITLKH